MKLVGVSPFCTEKLMSVITKFKYLLQVQNLFSNIYLIVLNFQIPDCLGTRMCLVSGTFEIMVRLINSVGSCEC